jgi:hypothetical protein
MEQTDDGVAEAWPRAGPKREPAEPAPGWRQPGAGSAGARGERLNVIPSLAVPKEGT